MLKQIRVSTGKYTIQRKERKETIHASELVWTYNDTNLIMWRCSCICTTMKGSLGNERDFFFGIYCLSQRRCREYDPEDFSCIECVCLCVCARVWATCRQYTRQAFLMGLLTHLGVATRLARRAFAIHLAHVWTIAKPCLETLYHQSQHSSSLLRIRPLETRPDEISTDLLEDSDDAVTVWYALVGASCSRSCPSKDLSVI